ncbi:unnamed protein product [Linum tenue]|uniref:Uncharacterized protein n=1 Tax=Linum tenue TaxID=586396 RepID=A0AAV0L691_9ROSI|nr:unnamed protein product [Linum tenue]
MVRPPSSTRLSIIALGTGGIKPFVSSFGADHFYMVAAWQRFDERGRVWALWAVLTATAGIRFALGRAATLWRSMAVMCAFSVAVQVAAGLVFGVVPFVSKSASKVICGAGVVKGFKGKQPFQLLGGDANSVAGGYTKGDGLGAEIVGTFVLVYTVFSAADAKRSARDSHVPIIN